MSVSIPCDMYDDCRRTCLTAGDHLTYLAAKLPNSDDFYRAGFFLTRQILIDTATLMTQRVSIGEKAEIYTIEDVIFDDFLKRIAGIIGIVTAFSETSGATGFKHLVGMLIISFTRLYNFRLNRQ